MALSHHLENTRHIKHYITDPEAVYTDHDKSQVIVWHVYKYS